MRAEQMDRLRRLASPDASAVLTMELQRGIVGDLGTLPAIREQCLSQGTVTNAGRVCAAARAAGARVVHCTIEHRPDGLGFAVNCKMFALMAKHRQATGHWSTEKGGPGAELMAELGACPEDVFVSRTHGMTPFTSTSLDQILRNMGVTTVVATGVSVNLGIFGMTISAVDLGYQVIVVRDAVAGVPPAYADSVIDNSLSLLATVVTTDELMAAWSTS